MVRCRFVDSVVIQVTGPKSVLPNGPIMKTGRLSMTWIHFLNGICGLQLEPSRGDYFICNSTYTTTSEGGWAANLNDTIKPFIEKFSRKRSLYCVRLHTGKIPDADADASDNDNTTNIAASATAPPSTTPETNTNDDNDTTQPWMSTSSGKPTPKMKTTPVKKFASTVPLKPSQCPWTSPPPPPTSSQSQNEPSASTSSLSTANAVQLLPTPVLRIPIRGCPPGTSFSPPQQSVTADQLFQKPDGKGIPPMPSTSKSRRNPPVSSGSSNKKKDKFIPEFTLRISTGRLSKNTLVPLSVSEPSPPKLSRFDELGMSPPAEPQPGPSNAATRCSSSPRKNLKSLSSSLKRRFDETDAAERGGSKNCNTLVAIKREIIEIDLAEMEESDEEEEEEQQQLQQGNGHDPQAFLQNERNILGILGILGDDEENDEENDEGGLDLVSQIERKLDGFGEAMLLKVKQEIRKLKQNRMWARNAKRSPMACYLLQEIFKD